MYVIVMDILILVTISHIIKSFELFELKTIIAYNKSNSATCIILSQIQNQCMASWGLSDFKKILFGHPPPQWEYRNQGPPDCELDMTCVISEAYVRRRKEREKDGHV